MKFRLGYPDRINSDYWNQYILKYLAFFILYLKILYWEFSVVCGAIAQLGLRPPYFVVSRPHTLDTHPAELI